MSQTSETTMTDASLATEEADADAEVAREERAEPERQPNPSPDAELECEPAPTPEPSRRGAGGRRIGCFPMSLGVLFALLITLPAVVPWLVFIFLMNQ